MNSKIIAVDFDGTLCENKWPEIGEAKVIFNFLKKKGDESFERVFKSILGRRNVR